MKDVQSIKQVINLAERGSFNHLFQPGTTELPKNLRSQGAGNLYDFINFKNGFYTPIYNLFEAYKDVLLEGIEVPLGELAIRLVRYKTREPFYPHIDVNYKSIAIVAANGVDEFMLLDSVIYGRQAKELSNKHPKFHHFNQNGMKYYLGIFASARGDLKLSCGLTIDEYMQQQYYYSNNF